jgi:hypothetical protein
VGGLISEDCPTSRHQLFLRRQVLDRGESKVTALVAAMRKLPTIINSMVAKGELWNPRIG